MRRDVFILFSSMLIAVRTFGADLSFTGTFVSDDEKKALTFTLATPATVVIKTLSYAGGLNARNVTVPRGGFDPTLSLFDSAGHLIAVNRDGGCDKVKPDQVTSFCWDAYLSVPLPAGSWQVVLTQSENLPLGPTLADSWVYEGTGNFTADPEGPDKAGFWDFYPDHRSGSWAVDILGADGDPTSDKPGAPPVTPPAPTFVNSASFQTISPGPNTVLTMFDKSLISGPANQDSAVTVSLDGVPVEILFVGNGQVNFVIPPDVTPKNGAKLQIVRGTTVLASSTIDIADASPALFTQLASGTGQAAVLNASTSGISFNGATPPAQPARCGSYIAVFGTGFGAANAPDVNGLSWISQSVTATVGGRLSQVVFAGLAPTQTKGLQQINIQLPEDCSTGPAVPVRLQVGTHLSQSGTTIAIQ